MAGSFGMGLVFFGVLAVVALAGVVLVVLGIVGRARFDDPRCGKCRYDLRTFGQRPQSCPECGADLTRSGSVRFASRVRRPALTIVGLLLLVLPAVTILGVRVAVRNSVGIAAGSAPTGPQTAQGMTNTQLVAALAGAEGDQRWLWNEVGARLNGGTLGRADANGAIDALIARLAAPKPDGGEAEDGQDPNMSLRSWSDEAVAALCDSNLLDDAKRIELAKAWVGSPSVSLPERARGNGVRLSTSGLRGTSRMFSLVERIASIRVDGAPVGETSDRPARPGPLQARMLPALAPGEHEIEVDIEWVVSHTDKSAGAVRLLGDGDVFENVERLPDPVGDDPRRLAHGVTTVKRRITIVAPDEPLRQAFVDELQRAAVQGSLSVGQATVRARQAAMGVRLTMKIDVKSPPENVPMLLAPVVTIDGQSHRAEPFAVVGTRNGHRTSGMTTFNIDLPALDPSVTSIDLVLEPDLNTKFGNGTRWNRVWGEPIVIKDVRLDRRDLEGAGP